MSRYTFTSYGGCDIMLIDPDENKVVAELQAITWNEQGHVRGSLTITEGTTESSRGALEIKIHYINEDCYTHGILFENVVVYAEPDGDVWTFKANRVVRGAWKDGWQWDKDI